MKSFCVAASEDQPMRLALFRGDSILAVFDACVSEFLMCITLCSDSDIKMIWFSCKGLSWTCIGAVCVMQSSTQVGSCCSALHDLVSRQICDPSLRDRTFVSSSRVSLSLIQVLSSSSVLLHVQAYGLPRVIRLLTV